MSQTVTNLLAGTQANSIMSTGNSKGTATVDPAQSFSQAMLSMMTGDGKSQQTQLLTQLNALLGVISEATGGEAEVDPGAESLNSMMDSLLQQLEQLDEALVDNPALLSALQSWMIQAQQTLQPSDIVRDTETLSTIEAKVPALAQHMETIKFALHDTLLQLAAANLESRSAGLNSNGVQSFENLLGSLKSILAEAGLSGEVKGADAQHPRFTVSNRGQNVIPHLAADRSLRIDAGQGNVAKVDETIPTAHLARAVDLTAAEAITASGRVLEGAEKSGSGSNTADDLSNFQLGHVVTAGQLALRDAGTAQLTVKAPPVPVENFGKEVGQFLINKLDIIKTQGMSEARISLNPQHLGSVDVQIKMQNGQLVAQFITEHAFAKESLEAQMSQLRSALQAQGLQVSKLEVTQNTSLSSHMYHDGRQPGSGSNGQQQSKRRDVTVSEEELLSVYDLNEEWNNWISEVRAKELNMGSSFVARA
ncbi:flagellar hook-length control protein FliK [Paenibacillus motobuensis]|uniref:Flagellar hook-length control protein-like C-terminal domain-containing protein n=1 Tax=Paenibacillus motobuensis TaxID=295324 RepID=A0ABP3ICE0_9BACL